MKIIVNQNGDGMYTVNGGLFMNISRVDMGGGFLYSVGINNISFGLYKKEKFAQSALNAVMKFIVDKDESNDTFRFNLDK